MVEREGPIVESQVAKKFTLADAEEGHFAPVNPDWFTAYREGNLQWPQVGLGMHIKLLDALLRCPAASAQDFLTAQLSEGQINEEVDLMKKVHAARNIAPPPWRFAKGYPARIAKLWRWAKLSVGNEIVKYQTGVSGNEILNDRTDITSAITRPLDGFFQEVIPSATGERIKRMASDAVAALDSPHGKALATVHRFYLDNRNENIVIPQMKAYCERHGIRFMGKVDIYASLGKKYVREQIHKYPPEMQMLLNIYS